MPISQIELIIHSIMYIETYHVPSTLLDIGDTVINKIGQVPLLTGIYYLMGKIINGTKDRRDLNSQNVVAEVSIFGHLFALLSIFTWFQP